MQRTALIIQYNGARFHGWQAQGHCSPTVQDELQKALSKIANEPIEVVCAGRTDTGVHAVGQVVHFDSTAQRSPRAWMLGTNTHLPADISVAWAGHVNDEFHARFTAHARRYRYVIRNVETRSAILAKQVTEHRYPLNVSAMHTAAQLLLGENDFSSFRASQCQSNSPNRNMHSISVTHRGEFIFVDLQANAFVHHMVRNIVGSLLLVGEGRKPVEWLAELLSAKDRTQAGATAPADGLYFAQALYDEQWGIPETNMEIFGE